MNRQSIYSNRTLNQSAKLLLLYLTEFKPVKPKRFELAESISVSDTTIKTCLEQLESLGYIQEGVHVIDNGN